MNKPMPGSREPDEIASDDMRVLARARDQYGERFPLMAFPTKSGEWWLLHEHAYRELCETFIGVDVAYELRVAFAWLMANETRLKTERGMRRFLTGWLNRVRQ